MAINSTLNRVDVVKRAKDVVGRIKVSMSQNMYDADFEYGKQPLRWEEFTAGGGTITHLPGVGACALYLPAGSPSALTIRQSRPYHRYQPGKSMFMATAIQLGAANSNQFQRFGFFDDANGMFFEQGVTSAANPSGMYCVIRTDTNYFPAATAPQYIVQTTATGSSGAFTITVGSATGLFVGQYVYGSNLGSNAYVTAISGTTVTLSTANYGAISGNINFQYLCTDVRTSYENWSDPQNIKSQIDWTKIQMFWLEYAWYGAGCLRWGVLINGEPFVLHEVGSGNNGSYGGGVLPGTGAGVVAWSRTGNLPVRYEQRDNGSAAANTMYHYGVAVMLEGRKDEQRGFTYSYGMNPAAPRRYVAPNATRYPVLSIQPRVMGIQELGTTGGLADSTMSVSPFSTINYIQVGTSITLPKVASFSGNGSTGIITFRKAHGLPTSNSTVVLSGFSPAGLNGTYTSAYVSPSTISITTTTTSATTLGSVSASSAYLGTKQFAGRSYYYQGTDGLFYMARVTRNDASAIFFVDPIQGFVMPVAPLTATATNTASTTIGSAACTYSAGSGTIFVGMTISSSAFPAGTTVVSFTGTTSGTILASNQATSTGSTTLTINPTWTIGQINRGQLLPLQLMVSSDSLCVVELIASTPGNPIVLTNSAFQQLSTLGSPNSFSTRDVSATALTGGEVVNAFTTPAGGSGIIPIDLQNFFPLYNTILGNLPDILTVAITTKATQTSAPPVASISGNGTTVTMTFTGIHGLNVGDSVTLSGFTPSGLNGTFSVSATPTANSIQFLSAATSATALGVAVFSNGANVGAHLICQEAMS